MNSLNNASNFRPAILAAAAKDLVSMAKVPTATIETLGHFAFRRWLPWLYSDYFFLDNPLYILNFYNNQKEVINILVSRTVFSMPQVLILDNTSDSISTANITFRQSGDLFVPGKDIIGRTNLLFRQLRRYQTSKLRKYENGMLLRLSDINHINNKIELAVQPVRYEIVCRTHLCIDAKEKSQSQTLREYLHPNRKIKNLKRSLFANALGVNYLFLTAEGYAVLPLRTKKVAVRPNLLSPTASGDFEYSDAFDGVTLDNIHLLREPFEELQILSKHLSNEGIRFLGITRELARGGKPEMFFSANTDLTKEDFIRLHKGATDRYEFTRKGKGWVFWDFSEGRKNSLNENEKYILRNSFENLIKLHSNRISLPLLTILVLWIKSKIGNICSIN